MTDAPDDTIDPAIWDAEPLFADRFYVSTTDMIRLTFGEGTTGDAARYHSAVVMTRGIATDLRDLLTKVLADMGG